MALDDWARPMMTQQKNNLRDDVALNVLSSL